ncbi:hypothetical protein [Nocardioides sp.]|uniref:hypothetical protein n=1 Tax=Nocardioides sp. TaxID=35761 RepID=UPI002D8029D6|nr:hypothetical protein [Nocardioides sp.]HET8961641.1 hypothetical protein [Nocardioides sp.]
MRRLITLTAGLTLGAGLAIAPILAGPASAHGDKGADLREARTSLLASGEDTALRSGNVQHLANKPGTAGISGCFTKTAPLFVTSGLESVQVWNVKDATDPTRVGVLQNAVFENEAMNCGERRTEDGTRRFALIGVDLYQASAADPQHFNAGGNEVVVVDVTDPTAPEIVGRAPAQTSTHTVACVDDYNCRYAYSAGDSGSGTFSIIDLRNIEKPREVDSNPDKAGVQAFRSPTAGHKWNFDNAGIGTHTGWDGSSMWNVDRPRHPRLLATTGKAGGAGDAAGAKGYNDFIHHNSFRPNAKAFRAHSRPSLANGNVLLVTEEDYEQTDCAKAGSFQTWHIRSLNGGRGGIVPLDKVELADLGNFPSPRGAFCSAHWFDYRPGGIVAIGYYGGGTQFIDVRHPRALKSHGYAHWGISEVWDAMWVPVYDRRGNQTGASSNVVLAVDLARGLDVYSVDVPGDGRGSNPYPSAVTDRSVVGRISNGAVPIGLVGAALALGAALHRRSRRQT